jgi:pyruvate,orthophosphate dikinase
MVFGNMGDQIRHRRGLHPQSIDRRKGLYGEFLVNAQGEDVVAGIRTPQSITEAARIEAGPTGRRSKS